MMLTPKRKLKCVPKSEDPFVKDALLQLRCNAQFMDMLKAMAKLQKVSVSKYVREAINARLACEL